MAAESPAPKAGAPVKHGLTVLKAAVKGLGGRLIDRRTTLGKALAAWRSDLVADLGGAESVSTQQAAIIDLAVRTKLMLDSIDAWVLTQPALVDKRKRALLPAVKERQQLADSLARYLTTLGLGRTSKPVDLSDWKPAVPVHETHDPAPPAAPIPMNQNGAQKAEAEG
jgi:hypothetical protein